MRQLTKSVAQHCAQEQLNIRCNSVHPSDVLTPLWEKRAQELAQVRGLSVEQIVEEANAYTPLGDLTLPEDVAAAGAFLVSVGSRRMTGAAVMVDGGAVDCDTYQVGLPSSAHRSSKA